MLTHTVNNQSNSKQEKFYKTKHPDSFSHFFQEKKKNGRTNRLNIYTTF